MGPNIRWKSEWITLIPMMYDEHNNNSTRNTTVINVIKKEAKRNTQTHMTVSMAWSRWIRGTKVCYTSNRYADVTHSPDVALIIHHWGSLTLIITVTTGWCTSYLDWMHAIIHTHNKIIIRFSFFSRVGPFYGERGLIEVASSIDKTVKIASE